MFKSKKTIYFILLNVMLAFTILVGAFSHNVTASTDGTFIHYDKNGNFGFIAEATNYDADNPSNNSEIKNRDYTLLKNDPSYNARNSIEFKIYSDGARTDKYITSLRVNAYLNGRAIDVEVKRGIDPTLKEINPSLFVNSLTFTISRSSTIKFKDTEDQVEDLQGHYEFDFQVGLYNIKDGSDVSLPNGYDWFKFEFTVIDESQYSNASQQVKLSNVENKTIGGNVSYINNYSYVESNETKYGYADLSFDPERYKLIISRTYQGSVSTIETFFEYYLDETFATLTNQKSDYGKLIFRYPNRNNVIFNLQRVGQIFEFKESKFVFNGTNTVGYSMPLLYELGEYELQPYYQIYQNGELLYDNSQKSPVAINKIKLKVYGFNINYAHNVTEQKYFTSFANKIESGINTDLSISADFSNKQETTIEELSIPSTNQAPVWFNSLVGNFSIKYFHSNTINNFKETLKTNNTDSTIEGAISNASTTASKNQYFTEAGYYFVVCNYSNETNVETDKSSIFIFQIKNNTPTITIKTIQNDGGIEKESTLPSGGFTNGKVHIEMDKLGLFDSEITTEYSVNTAFENTFSSYSVFTPKINGVSGAFTTFTTAGKYSIKVKFGIQSCSYYSFTIDTTPIENFVRAYSVKKMSLTSNNYLTDGQAITDKIVTNKDFTFIILEKPSGAKISAKLITYDIESYEPNQVEVYTSNNGKDYIGSRYIATYASSPSDYNNIVPLFSNYVNQNYVFSEHKIYIFQVSDECGFEYNHIVYLDKSSANVLQFDSSNQLADVTDFNVVSSKTKMQWSDFKGLNFLENSKISSKPAKDRNFIAQTILSSNSNYFDYNGSSFVMLLDIGDIIIKSTDLNGKVVANTGDIYSEYKNSKEFTIYGKSAEAMADNLTNYAKLVGEKLYTVQIFDESGNYTTYEIEVNMDKSLGKMFTTNEKTIIDNNYRTNILKINQAGSLDYLIFEWKDAESGAFKIQSLTWDFYPLTYDTNSTNFPYSATATKSGDLLTKIEDSLSKPAYFVNNSTELGDLAPLHYSEPINVVSASFTETQNGEIVITNKNVSEPGKYVIKRIYAGDGNGGNSSEVANAGDTQEKTYTYLVDRNPILDYPQSNLIPGTSSYSHGAGVKLVFGSTETKEFSEFYRQEIAIHSATNFRIGLESNLLPIQIKVPRTKYYHLANLNSVVENYPYFDLIVTLEKYSNYGELLFSEVYNEDVTNPEVDDNGFIIIPEIKSSGYYRLKISDRSELPNTQISPMINNSDYFAFYVNLSGPQASIQSSNSEALIAGDSPLSMKISGNQYEYSANTTIVSNVQTYSRKISISNPNTNIEFSAGEGERSWSYTTQKLNIFDTNSIDTMIQYMFVINYNDGRPSTTQYSPLPTDYNNYKEAINGSSTKDNHIILTFNEPDEVYMASIDTSDITITKQLKTNGTYGSAETLMADVDYVLQQRLDPNTKKIQYSIEFYNIKKETTPNNEYRFNISYHFKGQDQYFVAESGNGPVSYYSANQVIYVDKSAPSYNISRLAQLPANTTMLSKTNVPVFESDFYQDVNGVYYFANKSNFDFAITSDFSFNQPTLNGVVDTQEGNQIFYRKYHKYDESQYQNEENKAYQAIVPGDSDFISGHNASLRFNAVDTNTWKPFLYNRPFISQIPLSTLNENERYGYYEIVEIDAVGNHSIYTVLYDNPATKAKFKTNNEEGNVEEIILPSDNSVSSYNSIEFVGAEANDTWFIVNVDSAEYLITPIDNAESERAIRAINNHLNNGRNSYAFTMTNRFGNPINIIVYVSTSGKELGVKTHSNIPEENQLYKVIFDDDSEGLIMEKIRAFKFDSQTKEYVELVDDENRPIDGDGNLLDPKQTRTYYFAKGIYRFVIEDNFRKGESASVFPLNIDTGVDTYSFDYSAPTKLVNGKLYTTDNITLNADTSLYSVIATRNGESISVTSSTFIFSAPNLSPEASITSGGEYEYVITISNNTTEEIFEHTFVIYNLFPAINAENSKQEIMNKILATDTANVSTFTSDAIYLHWNTSGFKFAFDFTLIKYSALNTGVIESSQNISGGGVSVTNKGAYELLITNRTLGNTRSVWFVIKESNISMYSVSEKLGDGGLEELKPSDSLLDISGYRGQIETLLQQYGKPFTLSNSLKVKNYFTISEIEIAVDGDKGLGTNWGKTNEEIIFQHTGNLSENFNTKIVIVYGLSPYNYLDVFAVTKILSNQRFLDTINYEYYGVIEPATEEKEAQYGTISVPVNTTSNSNIMVYENPFTIRWNSYYGIPQNKIFMTYSFNGKQIKTIAGGNQETTSITLTDDGEYKLSFTDLAGNVNLFGDLYATELTIIVNSNVKVAINEQQSVYGIVYNDDVTFTILEPNEYTSLKVEVYRNGKLEDIDITRTKPSYTFTESGFYKINVFGTVRTSESTTKQLNKAEYVFTIINPNESRFAYEFSSINGYEIIKVTRNGFDVTNEIKNNNSSINSLVLSDDINGVGKYRITVSANFINSLRESEEFAFNVWINNKTPSLDISIKRNETSVDPIKIKYNPSALYEQLGECKIVLGSTVIEIDESALNKEENAELTITNAGTYYITLLTASGNVISIYKVTKQDPLNTLSIILIVIGSALLIAGGYLFFRLRVKMKIK